MTARLAGSPQPVSLGQGYALRAPGVRGSAELRTPRSPAERARSRSAEDGTEALDAALAAANLTEVRQVDIRLEPSAAAEATRALRSADGQEVLELQVPDLGPETGQLVLACDECGVLTWHLPVDDAQRVQPPTTRGSGGVKRFLVPATRIAPPPAAPAGGRSLIGLLGRKLLKVLVYPVLDPLVGAISELFAERWEEKKRPYGLRDFSPANFREPAAPELGTGDWDRLAAGRALLFVHGTFSTAHAAFNQISDGTFAELHRRYGGRVFAFNHYTLSHDPKRNVEWLLGRLPGNRGLKLDIVCHSRGGLVARTLAERPSVFGLDTSGIDVGRIVFAAAPNGGTVLTQPDHMVRMVDRLTSALNLFPSGPVAETLEALITAVKVIGHGALKGLDGLAAMRPGGPFLQALNTGGPGSAEYYGIAADFEPGDDGLKALLAGAVADTVMDRVFGQVPNDLVVPEPGVYSANGNNSFPFPPGRVLQVPPRAGIIHTTIFGYPAADRKLLDWLPG